MRHATTALVAALVGLGATTAHAAVTLDLTVVGGSATAGGGACEDSVRCVAAAPGDDVVIEITTILDSSDDAVVIVNPAFSWDPEAGSLRDAQAEGGSTEVAGQDVNGVSMTPLVLETDIREVVPGLADGWELQTFVSEGGAGPATFSLGTLVVDLTGEATTIGMEETIGIPSGTSVGGAGFVNITDLVVYSEIQIVPVPEPAPVAGSLAVLAAISAVARTRARPPRREA